MSPAIFYRKKKVIILKIILHTNLKEFLEYTRQLELWQIDIREYSQNWSDKNFLYFVRKSKKYVLGYAGYYYIIVIAVFAFNFEM